MGRTKAADKIIAAVRREPGIEQQRLPEVLGKAARNGIMVSALHTLLGARAIERVLEGKTFRLYLKGSAPEHRKIEPARYGCWQLNGPVNSARGERFFYEFDEAFGLLYCDLKTIAGAAGGA